MSCSCRSFVTLALTTVLSAALGWAEPDPAAAAPGPEVTSGDVLTGHWRRPDGGYVIQIKSVGENGQLDAAYFNPRPIGVESAQWVWGGGVLQLRIRLNDTGYRGAYYLLRYDPTTNRLVGEYHPANQPTFEVAFERLLAPPRE